MYICNKNVSQKFLVFGRNSNSSSFERFVCWINPSRCSISYFTRKLWHSHTNENYCDARTYMRCSRLNTAANSAAARLYATFTAVSRYRIHHGDWNENAPMTKRDPRVMRCFRCFITLFYSNR